MIFNGRPISNGKARGEVIKLEEPLSFLGGVDGSTGDIRVRDGNVAGKILVFPRGKGSTVGSYVMYDLKVHGKEPAAVINESAETIVATGAVISSIPMVDQIPSVRIFEDGDIVSVDATKGTVEIEGVVFKEVVSSVVSRNGRCILEKRPESNHSYPGCWSLVAGKVEDGESPVEAARREILEETSIEVGEPLDSMEPLYVREGKVLFKVYPFHFDAGEKDPVLNDENEDWMWASPEDAEKLGTVTDTVTVMRRFLSR
jgi:hypothetical protein